MTVPTVTGPEALTGAIVEDFRKRHKWSRGALSAMMNPANKSGARIDNIEKRESWKPGDRERLWELMQEHDRGVTPLPIELRGVSGEGDGRTGNAGRAGEPGSREPADGAPEGTPVHTQDIISAKLQEILDAHARGEHVELAANCGACTVGEEITCGCDDDDDLEIVWLESTDPFADAQRELDAKRSLLDQLAARVHPELVEAPPPTTLAFPADTRLMTNGEHQTWNRCPRKWWLAWFRGLQPRAGNPTSARATGDRVHRALAMWYVPDGTPRIDPREALERVIIEDWTAVVQGLDLGDDPGADPRYHELARRFHDANTLERAMIEGYVGWLQETGADADYDVIGSEQVLSAQLDVPDPPPSNAVPEGPFGGEWVRPITVLSLQDVRLRRRTDGVRLFIDHKTTGDLKKAVPTLPMDEQMLHYHLLEWLNTPDGEVRCDGALYNMLRKVKRTSAAKPPFYDRIEVRHNTHEIESYRRRLLASTRAILRAEDALRAGADPLDVVPPVPRESCSWSCDFFAICPMFDDGSRAEDAVAGLFVRTDNYARYGIVRENA